MEDGSVELRIAKDGSVNLPVKVIPRASKTAWAGMRDGAFLVRLCAPPVEGKANAALTEFVASSLGLRKNQIAIKTGDKSRLKLLSVTGLDVQEILTKIRSLIQ